MATDKKTIGIASLIAMGLISISMLVPGFFDSPKYVCESRPELGVVSCDSFSKYVDIQGKCIRDDNTNLICRDGWKEIIDDRDIPDEEIIEEENKKNIYSSNVIKCTEVGCIDK